MKRLHEKDEKTRIKESDDYAVMKCFQELGEPKKRKETECKYCGQEFNTKGHRSSHETRCDLNPAWVEEKKRRRESMGRLGIPSMNNSSNHRDRHPENYCSKCGRKLQNREKEASHNAGLKKPICRDCAYALSAKVWEV